MGGQSRLADTARCCTCQYPYRPESEVGHLDESCAARDSRYDDSQVAVAESEEGKLVVRLPEKPPVFSRYERLVLGTVSVLLCLISVLLTVRFAVSRAERDFRQQAALVYEDMS